MKLLRPRRERDFALLWTDMTVSLLGDGIFIVAEARQVYDIKNDPVALGASGPCACARCRRPASSARRGASSARP